MPPRAPDPPNDHADPTILAERPESPVDIDDFEKRSADLSGADIIMSTETDLSDEEPDLDEEVASTNPGPDATTDESSSLRVPRPRSPCCGEATIVVSATAPAPHMDTAPLSPAVPSGEGTSRSKGKGPDPRNWGGLDFSDEFSESELKAQKEALSNFEEINRMIKQEELPTPPGFFNDLPDTGSIAEHRPEQVVVFKEPPRKRDGKMSGQTPSNKHVKSERDSRYYSNQF
ncbi:hypothetical protein B0H14DRAFT_2645580 [Mycena olivaceomarginata]|nr:hypothetical protein B0H14DRAFT_2645580 [Mycena olivaceomarginata]